MITFVFWFWYCHIVLNAAVELNPADNKTGGHYRCTWHSGPATAGTSTLTTLPSVATDQSSCYVEDSRRMTSYINHCANRNFISLLACGDNGKWNCNNFISICKTLVRMDTTQEKDILTKTAGKKSSDSLTRTPVAGDVKTRTFDPNENYFTMKEMAIAVLVSFIAGATMLAVVICVVWRCRNSQLTSEEKRGAAHQRAKRCAALHAITHIANAFGAAQDQQSNGTFNNPYYGQVISSEHLLNDILNEHDRVYEEIFSRRKSSNHYATIDTPRKSSAVVRNRSTGDLKTVDETVNESDVGYEADSNNTPQTPRRKRGVISNVLYKATKGPVVNMFEPSSPCPFRNEFQTGKSYKNNLFISENMVTMANDEQMVQQPPSDNQDEVEKMSVNKCDSGYMEDEIGSDINKVLDSGYSESEKSTETTETSSPRKQSLRL